MKCVTPILLAALIAVPLPAGAQDVRGTIQGTVQDTAGALVPGAAVRVINVDTRVVTQTLTNGVGYYEAQFLIPGKYQVECAKQGFKKSLREGITLLTRQQAVVNLTLDVGALAESVTVKEDVPLVETASATAGLALDNKRILELPLTSNNVFLATTLVAGVTNDQGTFGAGPTDRNGYAPRVGGAGFGGSEYTVDGMSTAIGGNRVSFVPTQFVVQEFKVETTPFDASMSGAQGGFFSASTKSGTNEFHGNLWWTHRQNRLNATPWAVNRQFYADVAAGRKSPDAEKQLPGRMNNYGFTLGGPVVLPYWKDGKPQLWSAKNKLFFFFSYSGDRSAGQGGRYYRMPTDLEKQGNFSELLQRGGAQFQIYDPATAALQSNGVVTRSPFAGNIVPASRISNIARSYLNFWPSPNNLAAANNDLTNNHFSSNEVTRSNLDYLITRVDYNVSDRHRVFVRWYGNEFTDRRSDWSGQGLVGEANLRRNQGILADHVWTKSASTIFNVKAGWAVNDMNGSASGLGVDPATMGFPSYLGERVAPFYHRPGILLSNLTSIEQGYQNTTKYYSANAQGSVVHVRGRHSLRAGLDFRQFQYTDIRPGIGSGEFSFSSSYTRASSNASAPSSGLDFAAFLLGLPNGGRVDTNSFFGNYDYLYQFYFQDDFRVSRRLTLNLGMRYELPTPLREKHNRNTREYDFTTPSPINDQARAAYARSPIAEVPVSAFRAMGGPVFVGVNGASTGVYEQSKGIVLPRIGFSYQLFNRTVIRGGYAVYAESAVGTQATERAGQHYGFNVTTNMVPTTDNGLTFLATLADPFPATLAGGKRFLEPVGAGLGLMTEAGRSFTFIDPQQNIPYAHRVRVGVQQGFLTDWVGEVAYVGSAMRNVWFSRGVNALPQQYWATGASRQDAVYADMSRQVANPFAGLLAGSGMNGATVQKQQLLRPYPHYTGITVSNWGIGGSRFDSMEASVQKRLSQGYTVQFAYTLQKQFSDRFFNDFETNATRYLSNWINRFTANGVWDIPFGKGRRFGSQAPGWLSHVAGGWTLSAVYQYQRRGPLAFDSNYLLVDSASGVYVPAGDTTPERKFNVAPFNRVPAQQLGSPHVRVNSPFVDSRIPITDAVNQWDGSLMKDFHFTEQRYVRFKFDAYNVFNLPMFSGPVTNPTAGNFGQVNGFSTYAPMRQLQFNVQLFY